MPSTKIPRELLAVPLNKEAKNDNNDLNTVPVIKGGVKRKAESSTQDKVKRSVLGNLTNAVINNTKKPIKEIGNVRRDTTGMVAPPPHKKQPTAISNPTNTRQMTLLKGENIKVIQPSLITTKKKGTNVLIGNVKLEMAPRQTKVMTRAAARATQSKPAHIGVTVNKKENVVKRPTRRLSTQFHKPLDNSSSMSSLSSADSCRSSHVETMYDINDVDRIENQSSVVPLDVADFDRENYNDPFQVSNYAMDIFNYLKSREEQFKIRDYISDQLYLSKWMRSLLVDWMVEIQETFEFNHETLYLAVKIVDLYLGKIIVLKDELQLVGASALFIACKCDEPSTPEIADFLDVCDGAYDKREMILMEMKVIKIIDFDLGIPLSYRFLRRYARCAKVPMSTLTLARYILEFSLMDYETITFSDSKMASAALYMALRMYKKSSWNKTLEYYTGYELEHFAKIVVVLNDGLHQKPRDDFKTVRNKYSHKIFFEVAKITLLSIEALFEGTSISYEFNEITVKV